MAEPVRWPFVVLLSQLRGPVSARLEPDGAVRAAIAKTLGLEALSAFDAEVTLAPWLDGAVLSGRFDAQMTRICGITTDPFETEAEGDFTLRFLPAGSPNGPADDAEIELDLEADDPPDVLEGDEIDVSAYLVEQLDLALDPFPRKPGATFDQPADDESASPFAQLAALRGKPQP